MGIWNVVSEGVERPMEAPPEESSAPIGDSPEDVDSPLNWANSSEDPEVSPRLQDALMKAMRGELSDAPRRYFHTNKPSARTIQMVLMKASGYSNKAIAAHFGITNPQCVSIALANPNAETLLATLIGFAADNVLDIQKRITGYAGEMLDTVVATVRTTKNDSLRVSSAFKLLEMAGHGAIEKKQVEQVVRVEGKQASQLLTALEEAFQEDDDSNEVDGRYEVLGTAIVDEETYRGPHLTPGDAKESAA